MVRVYPIIEPRDVFQRRACVDALIKCGIKMLQIRQDHSSGMKGSARELLDAGRAIIGEAFASGVTLIINDRVDIAKILGAGVHLGHNDVPSNEARKILGDHAIIGVSTHSPEEAAAVEGADYISVGPIFETMSKLDAAPVVGLDTLRAVRDRLASGGTDRRKRPPLAVIVAIGGISAYNFLSCIENGATYVGAIGAFRDDGGFLSMDCAAIAERVTC